jgi:hypothetical protein
MMTTGRKWTISELNLVNRAAKTRQTEDRLRADAWRKNRDAELEAVVNKVYDPMEIPAIRELIGRFTDAARPFIEEFDRLVAEHYPAEFSRPGLGIRVTPGGIPLDVRKQVRRDAATHLSARHAFMLANSANFVTETISDATMRATDNPEVAEVLERLAAPKPRDADIGAAGAGNRHPAPVVAAPRGMGLRRLRWRRIAVIARTRAGKGPAPTS